MKYIFAVMMSFLTFLSLAQVNLVISSTSNKEIVYYLDNVKIGKNQLFFDANKIASVQVMKENDTTKDVQGSIFIGSKDPHDFNFLSMAEIEKRFTNASPSATVFMINNEVLKDAIDSYKIDSSYILNVNVLEAKDIPNLKADFAGLTMVMINLKTSVDMSKTNQIRLRGTNVSTNN
jgi:hypothetical protein